VVFTLVADLAPLIEAVGRRRGVHLMSHRVSIGETRLFAGVYSNRGALAGGFAFALPYRDQS